MPKHPNTVHTPLLLFLLFLVILVSILVVNSQHKAKTDKSPSSTKPIPPPSPPPASLPPPPALPWVPVDVVVSLDGSGNFRRILDAVDHAPEHSSGRFVIRIKAGFYKENIKIVKDKPNLYFIGDGMNMTVLSSDRNRSDAPTHNLTTSKTATLTVVGEGFMAQDMTIENTAGPNGNQAVALLVQSDKSVFYRCNISGYQDTLYAKIGRQFYRECIIYGTVDFIFGRATALFQNCNIYARSPLPHQTTITFTAQGRNSTLLNNGFSIHNCTLTATPELEVDSTQLNISSYLGRPWKRYSMTIIMQSFLGDIIQPAGWLEWNSEYSTTLVYGEYGNRGPGSNTSQRVTWPGYRTLNSSVEARMFTVSEFLDGDLWLPTMNVPYTPGLIDADHNFDF